MSTRPSQVSCRDHYVVPPLHAHLADWLSPDQEDWGGGLLGRASSLVWAPMSPVAGDHARPHRLGSAHPMSLGTGLPERQTYRAEEKRGRQGALAPRALREKGKGNCSLPVDPTTQRPTGHLLESPHTCIKWGRSSESPLHAWPHSPQIENEGLCSGVWESSNISPSQGFQGRMLLEGLQVQRAAPETLPCDHSAETPQQPRPVPLGPQQQVWGGAAVMHFISTKIFIELSLSQTR